MKRDPKPEFASEADLCAAFIKNVEIKGGWVAYAETGGFDILLRRVVDDVQIGIEAKMQLNLKVMLQALPEQLAWSYGMNGPDYRAVLVPNGRCMEFKPLCDILGLTVIRMRADPEPGIRWPMYMPPLPEHKDSYLSQDWHEWGPVERIKLPDYIPDVAAGVKSPVTLSDWKVRAIKLMVILQERPVGRSDFHKLKLSPTRWLDPYTGWLERAPGGGWVARAGAPDFRIQHPRNYAEIEADKARWMRDAGIIGVLI